MKVNKKKPTTAGTVSPVGWPDLEFSLSIQLPATQARNRSAEDRRIAAATSSLSLNASLISSSGGSADSQGDVTRLVDTLASMACEQASSLAQVEGRKKNV
ncbi:MAG: hypothetical protein IH986_07665 [Planctomycetes bacterium]|nr:hypothetical protein [Planctomycetota bacterium]